MEILKGLELREGRFKWDIGKEFSPVRVVRHWHGLSRFAVAAPGSLAVPKARLDEALNPLGQWKVSLPMARDDL